MSFYRTTRVLDVKLIQSTFKKDGILIISFKYDKIYSIIVLKVKTMPKFLSKKLQYLGKNWLILSNPLKTCDVFICISPRQVVILIHFELFVLNNLHSKLGAGCNGSD